MLFHAVHVAMLVVGMVLVVLTLPLFLELLGLSMAAVLPARRLPAPDPDKHIHLCAVVPAHNEGKLIREAVQSLFEADVPPARVLVVAHNCSDDTAEHAEAAGAEVLRLNENSGHGKGAALFHGFEHALATGADAVLVLDADSRAGNTLPGEIIKAFAAGSEAIQARYVVLNYRQNNRTRLMALAFYGMNVLRPRGRSRLGMSAGIFGNGFALSRRTLETVPYTAHSVVEDLEYHLNLMKAGIRVDFLDWTEVRGEMPDNAKAATSQRARWEGGRKLIRRQWRLPVLGMVLRGRLRLFEPLLDLLAPPVSTFGGLLAVLLILPDLWFRLYADTGLLVLFLYIAVAARLSDEPVENTKALLFGFVYMGQKILTAGKTRKAARTDATWVRTERNEAP